jgi:hypothetical protein
MSVDLEPRRIVSLEEDGNAVDMEVYLEVEIEDRVYALLVPADLSVDLVEVTSKNDEETLVPVAPETVANLNSEINEGLKAWRVNFLVEDGEAILRGDPDEAFYADCETVEVDTEDGESEDFVVLLELSTGDSTYLLLTALTPELIAAELVGEGSARSLDDDELQELEDIFREALSMDEDL